MAAEPETASTLLDALSGAELDIASGVALGEQKRRLMAKMFAVELEPTRIDHYVLLDKLGEGGMGIVYAAYDPELDRKVAIKLLRSRSRSRAIRQLQTEARAMARLAHPNVVQIFDIGEADGLPFIAMELVDGPTLRAWLEAEPRSRDAILAVLRAAGEGLAAAHEKGLVHRDFKPENVMIRGDGRVLVMDFGLAGGELGAGVSGMRPIPLGPDSASQATVGGTPAYMAPEQFTSADADARADQYSFCVTAWEALSGQRPRSRVQPFAGIELVEPTRALPRRLRRALERGLASDPERRWPSMRALLRALDPRPVRRRRLILAAVAVGLGLAAPSTINLVEARAEARARAEGLAACEAKAAELETLWADAGRSQFDARIEAEGKPPGQSSWARARGWLDDFAAQWAADRYRACVETEVEHRRSPRDLARVERCLDDHRFRLQLLLDHEPSITTPQLGEQATLMLTELPSCLAINRERVPLPPEVDAEAVIAIERELWGIELSCQLEKRCTAVERIRSLRAEADALDWPPLNARVALTVATLEINAQRRHAALDSARQGHLEAVRGGDELLLLEAALILLRIEAHEFADHDHAEHWAAYAAELAARLGLEHTPRAVVLLVERGRLARKRGRYAEALKWTSQARALGSELLSPSYPVLLSINTEIANIHAERGDVAEAIAAYRSVIEDIVTHYGADDYGLVIPLSGLGNMYAFTGEDALALRAYEDALAIHERHRGPDALPSVPLLDNIGLVRLSLGDHDGALEILGRAHAFYSASLGSEHPRTIYALVGLARVHSARGEHELAVEHGRRALELEEEAFGPDNPYVARTLTTLGEIERRGDQPEAALSLHARALRIQDASLDGDTLVLADTLSALARARADAGEGPGARAALERAIRIRESKGGDPRRLTEDRELLGTLR